MTDKNLESDPLASVKLSADELDDNFAPKSKQSKVKPAPAKSSPAVVPEIVVDRTPKFRVARKITISWGGQMITLNEGDVVSDSGYGDRGMDKMRDAGVALEPV